MAFARFLAAALLLVLAACATAPAPQAPHPNFYVMRHLQKAAGQDPGLTAEGQANAVRLAALLANDPPSAIYVSTTRRARESAAPLAARLGLTMRDYDPSNTPALIEAVVKEPGTVLIVGHSNTVPDIIGRLGGDRPTDLADGDYGDVWHVYGTPRRTDKLSLAGR